MTLVEEILSLKAGIYNAYNRGITTGKNSAILDAKTTFLPLKVQSQYNLTEFVTPSGATLKGYDASLDSTLLNSVDVEFNTLTYPSTDGFPNCVYSIKNYNTVLTAYVFFDFYVKGYTRVGEYKEVRIFKSYPFSLQPSVIDTISFPTNQGDGATIDPNTASYELKVVGVYWYF